MRTSRYHCLFDSHVLKVVVSLFCSLDSKPHFFSFAFVGGSFTRDNFKMSFVCMPRISTIYTGLSIDFSRGDLLYNLCDPISFHQTISMLYRSVSVFQFRAANKVSITVTTR